MIRIEESGLHVVMEISPEGDVRLLHLSALPFDEETAGEASRQWFRLVEVQCSGAGQEAHHGSKHTGTVPGRRLRYKGHTDERNAAGRKIEVTLEDDGLVVVSHMQFYDGIAVVRAWTEVSNEGSERRDLEYVSSFALAGIEKEGRRSRDRKSRVHIGHNSWNQEFQWRQYSLPELGLSLANLKHFTLKRVKAGSTGTWPSSEFLPMGCYENTEAGTALVWQIEHTGSWHWEIGDLTGGHLYVQLSGPTEQENQWWKRLGPGERFETVPVAVGSVRGGFGAGIAELTRYRRAMRRSHRDNEVLPVIFNDYMNCLGADPTEEKELPLIEAAAEAGCECFVIDAGWYSDGGWWDSVGEWEASTTRFPNGLASLLSRIRAKGMVPGLWLEIEVMGVNCPLAKRVSDDWFFMRHGRRVIDNGRYQLDFRCAEVVAHADAVVDRLVKEWGVGYVKIDYNINAGVGTETNADSFGDGLLQHNRAYLGWIERTMDRYPDLVIESCASGGCRTDYAALRLHPIQSTSDQTDYRAYARISAASPTAVTPEQAGVWCYPLKDADKEQVVFNMVNALLFRIHLSGQIRQLPEDRKALVREGIAYYKRIRADLPKALPWWPLGVPTTDSQWVSVALRVEGQDYVAVWRLASRRATCELPFPHGKGKTRRVRCAYPAGMESPCSWDREEGALVVELPRRYSARIFEVVSGI